MVEIISLSRGKGKAEPQLCLSGKESAHYRNIQACAWSSLPCMRSTSNPNFLVRSLKASCSCSSILLYLARQLCFQLGLLYAKNLFALWWLFMQQSYWNIWLFLLKVSLGGACSSCPVLRHSNTTLHEVPCWLHALGRVSPHSRYRKISILHQHPDALLIWVSCGLPFISWF